MQGERLDGCLGFAITSGRVLPAQSHQGAQGHWLMRAALNCASTALTALP
jgi:hypothetical protein